MNAGNLRRTRISENRNQVMARSEISLMKSSRFEGEERRENREKNTVRNPKIIITPQKLADMQKPMSALVLFAESIGGMFGTHVNLRVRGQSSRSRISIFFAVAACSRALRLEDLALWSYTDAGAVNESPTNAAEDCDFQHEPPSQKWINVIFNSCLHFKRVNRTIYFRSVV